MRKYYILSGIFVGIAIISIFLWCRHAPVALHAFWQDVDNDIRTISEVSYETRKQVEDTCRAYIANYDAAAIMWEQYKNSTNTDEHNWAVQAKMRANRIATQYNNYILKNTFVWAKNVPDDIRMTLPIIE